MDRLGHDVEDTTGANATRRARRGRPGIAWAAAVALAGGALVAACGDTEETSTTSAGSTTATTTTTTGDATTSSSGGGEGGAGQGGSAEGGSGQGGSGGAATACEKTAPRATRGSAIALSPDESIVVSVNRDAGSVSVFAVDYSDGQPAMTLTAEVDLGAGSEPWQVAIDACGTRAYVVLRNDQKVVAIDNLATAPAVAGSVSVGSEPTALALTPNNTKLYVANWVDGTLTVINPETMTTTGTVDLNATLVATGLLGSVTSRPSLAHPRALAITNNGNASDTDETVYATEWFAQRTAPEAADGKNSDTNKQGLVYRVAVAGGAPATIALPPVADTGFPDRNGTKTGCFPNQLGSITIEGPQAYVTSTCASPVGPIGVFQKGACTTTSQCGSINALSVCTAGACTLACTTNADCGVVGGVCTLPAGTCNVDTNDAKTTTHPAVSVIDLSPETAVTRNLDFDFVGKSSTRMPLLPTDVGMFNNFAYVSAMGADAVFRLVLTNGQITDVGSSTNAFINLRKDATDKVIRTPIGVATGFTKAFAFVANDGSRDVTALAFNAQAIAGNQVDDFRIAQSSPLPAAGSQAEKELKGKRFFTTGLGRWSLGGAAWGSCAACHIDGLTDNVTWYFARGPRQSVSLDGSFAPGDPTDQRILNWTAIFDEIEDFEANTRGVSGGNGALVDAADVRINVAAESPPQQGLQGSSGDIADPAGASGHPHSAIADWLEIKEYIRSLRSPRKPTNLVQADVDAGRALFTSTAQANCVGCHSGAKWTVSKVFYSPGDGPNAGTTDVNPASLSNKPWDVSLSGFPTALFPITAAANQATDARMRFGAPPGAEQIQCILKPVGTFGVSPAAVNVVELRQDMVTAGQGAAATGSGFNPPSLFGLQVGAPYFHAGNARTLEEALDDTLFAGHHRSAIAQVFTPDATTTKQLVAFLLSIDEGEATLAIPAKGASGGDLCFYP